MAQNYTVSGIQERLSPRATGGFATEVIVSFTSAGGASSSISIPKADLEKLTPDKAREWVGAMLADAAARLDKILSL